MSPIKNACIILLILSVGCKNKEGATKYGTGKEGEPIPSFTIQTINGKFYNPANSEDKKKMVVVFFSVSRPYCRVETRRIASNMDRFKNYNFIFTSIEEEKELKAYAKHYKLEKFENVVVGKDTGKVMPKHYRIVGVPFTAVFDENKSLLRAYAGPIQIEQLLTHVDNKITAQKKP